MRVQSSSLNPAALTRNERFSPPTHGLAAVFVGVFALWVVTASGDDEPAPADVIRAKSFQLVDDEGRVRAEIGIDKDGSAGLFVRDKDGHLRGCLIHDDTQSALYLYDDEEQARVGAAFYAHGGGGFALHGPKGKGAAVLYYKDGGSLRFFDKDGKVTNEVPAKK